MPRDVKAQTSADIMVLRRMVTCFVRFILGLVILDLDTMLL
jgi:hypothetical protein